MNTKTKLIILVVLLLVAPLSALTIDSTYLYYITFMFSDYFISIIFTCIQLTTVFFGVLFGLYFMRFKKGMLTNFHSYAKWGIYLYITCFTLLVLDEVYHVLRYIPFNELYSVQYLQRYFWMNNYPSLILIALMYLSLRINKDIKVGTEASSKI